jgi:hypothetical protein
MRFKRPVFVTPHAIKRFQEHVADLPANDVIAIIQAALQDHRNIIGLQTWDRRPWPVFRCRYQDKEFFVPAQKEQGRKWPFVRTILLPGMELGITHEWKGGRWQWRC